MRSVQKKKINKYLRNSLAAQWLGLHDLTAKGLGLIPGQGTKTPEAQTCVTWPKILKFFQINIFLVSSLYPLHIGGT